MTGREHPIKAVPWKILLKNVISYQMLTHFCVLRYLFVVRLFDNHCVIAYICSFVYSNSLGPLIAMES